ncbi:MAG: hypothetical protein K9H64_07675 [Bacteroidales bacterium]|nr:hypothetical protein [Bacteroidales bacterium]MCF8455681.1 hypothetical protein [Bacteroidales bacterium]
MITKEKLKTHIDSFPDELSIDELIERLLFVEKLENRIAESENNETISEAELEKEIQEWFR